MRTLYFLLSITLLLSINIRSDSQVVTQAIEGSPEWQVLLLRSHNINGSFVHYAYSSELDEVDPYENEFGKYTILNLFDNNPATAWVEGVKGYGQGESLFIVPGEELPEAIKISNGYQKSESIYKSNSRLKTVRVTLYTGFFIDGEATDLAELYRIRELAGPVDYMLKDTTGQQEIRLNINHNTISELNGEYLADFMVTFTEQIAEIKNFCPDCDENPISRYIIKIEILDVYPGDKWDDTCISGIGFVYPEGVYKGIPESDKIEDVYESDDTDPGIFYVDTDKHKAIILAERSKLDESRDLVEGERIDIVLMDVSEDKEWAQVDLLFSHDGGGRVEEYSVLYHVRSLQRVSTSIVKTMYGMYGFTVVDGKTYLDTNDGLVDLEQVKKQLSGSGN